MRIVLRNTTFRKDAVYILDAVGFHSEGSGEYEYWLFAYWGRWAAFLSGGTSVLRKQEKYNGLVKVDLMAITQRIVAEKMNKGYRVQEEMSLLPEWLILPYGQNWREYE